MLACKKLLNLCQGISFIFAYLQVLGLEEQKGEWGFKALKQMIKINFKLGRLDEMMSKYKLLLTYIKVSMDVQAFTVGILLFLSEIHFSFIFLKKLSSHLTQHLVLEIKLIIFSTLVVIIESIFVSYTFS